jgi:hypothetical protein
VAYTLLTLLYMVYLSDRKGRVYMTGCACGRNQLPVDHQMDKLSDDPKWVTGPRHGTAWHLGAITTRGAGIYAIYHHDIRTSPVRSELCVYNYMACLSGRVARVSSRCHPHAAWSVNATRPSIGPRPSDSAQCVHVGFGVKKWLHWYRGALIQLCTCHSLFTNHL